MYQFVYWKKVVDTYDVGSIEKQNTIWCFVFQWSIAGESPPVSQNHLQNIELKLFTIIFKTNNIFSQIIPSSSYNIPITSVIRGTIYTSFLWA